MLRIQRGVKLQILVFLLISVLGIAYTGAHFVGFSAFNPTYLVRVDLPSSGGIFTNAEVTYRGVPVGRVGALHLTTNGVEADLHIQQHFDQIPAKTKAIVADLSAVGEQYVDLQPATSAGPFLRNNSTIPVQATGVPISDERLLINLNTLVKSVNLTDLQTTVTELGKAFAGTGPVLRKLITAGDNLTAAAQQNLPSNITLLNDGQTVLDTQRQVAGDLQTFAANLAQFSGQLVTSDADLRKLFTNGAAGASQLQQVLQANQSALPMLLGNLSTLAQISSARVLGIKQLLILYPGVVADGFLVTPGDGTAHFGLNADLGSPVCTQGYQATKRRDGSGNNPQVNYGGPGNLNADCTSPPSQTDVRGARLAPRPPGDTTATRHNYTPLAVPYGAAPASETGGTSSSASSSGASPSASASPAAVVTPYDPVSGVFQLPGGGTGELGSTGGEARLLGSQSWEYLLLGPLGQ